MTLLVSINRTQPDLVANLDTYISISLVLIGNKLLEIRKKMVCVNCNVSITLK